MVETLVKEFKLVKYPKLFLDSMLCNNTLCYDVYSNKTFALSTHNTMLKSSDRVFIWRIYLPKEKVLKFTHFPKGSEIYLYNVIKQLKFSGEKSIIINTTTLENGDTVVFIIP